MKDNRYNKLDFVRISHRAREIGNIDRIGSFKKLQNERNEHTHITSFRIVKQQVFCVFLSSATVKTCTK